MNKMNRRDAFKSFLALGVGTLMTLRQKGKAQSRATFANGPRWGYVTAETHTVSAYLNDVDVSDQCFEADDIRGFVGMFETDGRGRICAPLKKFRVYGRVRIERTGKE